MRCVVALIAALGAALPPTDLVAGQVARALTAKSELVVDRENGRFSRCGIRVLGVVHVNRQYETFLISIMSFADAGVVRFGKWASTEKEFKDGNTGAARAVVPAPISFYLAEETAMSGLSPENVFERQSNGFSDALVGAEINTVLRRLASGEQMHLSLDYEADEQKPIFSFSAGLQANEQRVLSACINGIRNP